MQDTQFHQHYGGRGGKNIQKNIARNLSDVENIGNIGFACRLQNGEKGKFRC
jgi:hypothetical protein